MGGLTFFNFLIKPADLLKIAFISHKQGRDIDDFNTYQRMLEPKRLEKIAKYVDTGGQFPTNIVINIKTDKKLCFDKIQEIGDSSVVSSFLYENRLPFIFLLKIITALDWIFICVISGRESTIRCTRLTGHVCVRALWLHLAIDLFTTIPMRLYVFRNQVKAQQRGLFPDVFELSFFVPKRQKGFSQIHKTSAFLDDIVNRLQYPMSNGNDGFS